MIALGFCPSRGKARFRKETNDRNSAFVMCSEPPCTGVISCRFMILRPGGRGTVGEPGDGYQLGEFGDDEVPIDGIWGSQN